MKRVDADAARRASQQREALPVRSDGGRHRAADVGASRTEEQAAGDRDAAEAGRAASVVSRNTYPPAWQNVTLSAGHTTMSNLLSSLMPRFEQEFSDLRQSRRIENAPKTKSAYCLMPPEAECYPGRSPEGLAWTKGAIMPASSTHHAAHARHTLHTSPNVSAAERIKYRTRRAPPRWLHRRER